ncbi:MAG: sugar phosphate nucleotidyltransferase [Chloroflexota bacterium]
MRDDHIHIVIPMAGLGTRVRPHTWSKPKPLMSLAGKTVLDHILDTFKTLPGSEELDLVFIVGKMADQIEKHMQTNYPGLNVHFVEQPEMRGQSHALWLAREYLHGPMLMVFSDTLLETDLSFLAQETADIVAWVKPVPDPERFGVAQLNNEGWVTRFVEKPKDKSNNLVVVGFYYFKRAEDLLSAIEEQMKRNIQLKGEYFIVDALNIMLERGLKVRVEKVDVWLDAGVPQTVLETNRYLLEHGRDNSEQITNNDNSVIIPPVFIHPSAEVRNSVIGPYTSIGAECRIESSIVRGSILDDKAAVINAILDASLVGRHVHFERHPATINIGDDSVITL